MVVLVGMTMCSGSAGASVCVVIAIMIVVIMRMGMSMLDHYKRIEEPRDFTRTCARYNGGHSHENVRSHSGVQRS